MRGTTWKFGLAAVYILCASQGMAAKEKSVEAPKESFRVVLTYPASITEAAKKKLHNTYFDARLKFWPSCSMSSGCADNDSVIDQTLVKTAYWVPYVVEELRAAAPEIVVELSPRVLTIMPNGKLGYDETINYNNSVPIVDFVSYIRPNISGGLYNEPTTFAIRVYPVFVVHRPKPTGTTLIAATDTLLYKSVDSTGIVLTDVANMGHDRKGRPPSVKIPGKQLKMTKEEWGHFTSLKPREFANQSALLDPPIAVLADALRREAPTDLAEEDANYADILGFQYSSLNVQQRALITEMRKADIAFSGLQTDAIISFLHEGEVGEATRNMLLSEREYLSKVLANLWTTALLSTLAGGMTGLAAGGNFYAGYQGIFERSVNADAAGRAALQQREVAFSPVVAQQLSQLRTEVGAKGGVAASSLVELREKFAKLIRESAIQ